MMLTTELKSIATTLEKWSTVMPLLTPQDLRAVASLLEEISQRVLHMEIGLVVPDAQRIDRAAIEAEGVLLLERYMQAAGESGSRSGGDAA